MMIMKTQFAMALCLAQLAGSGQRNLRYIARRGKSVDPAGVVALTPQPFGPVEARHLHVDQHQIEFFSSRKICLQMAASCNSGTVPTRQADTAMRKACGDAGGEVFCKRVSAGAVDKAPRRLG